MQTQLSTPHTQGADVDPLPMTLQSIGMAYAQNCLERTQLGLPLLEMPELDQRSVDKLELTRMVCTYGRATVELWIKNIAAVAHLGGL